MIRQRCFLDPFRWRRFILAADKYFHGPMLWIFFGSMPVLAVAWMIDSELLKRLATSGALFAFTSWLSLGGFAIVWKCTLVVLSARSNDRPVTLSAWNVTLFLVTLGNGVVFLGIGLWLAWVALKSWW